MFSSGGNPVRGSSNSDGRICLRLNALHRFDPAKSLISSLTLLLIVRKVKRNLVFGKAVQVRHYPVTVSAESWNKAVTTGAETLWEGRSKLVEA